MTDPTPQVKTKHNYTENRKIWLHEFIKIIHTVSLVKSRYKRTGEIRDGKNIRQKMTSLLYLAVTKLLPECALQNREGGRQEREKFK